jgi:hypothetical protein
VSLFGHSNGNGGSNQKQDGHGLGGKSDDDRDALPVRKLFGLRSLKDITTSEDCYYGRDFPSSGNGGGRKFKDTDPLCVALYGHSRDDKRGRKDRSGNAIQLGSRRDEDSSIGSGRPVRKLFGSLRSLKQLSDDCFASDGSGGSRFRETDRRCVAVFGNGKGDNRRD